MLSSSDSAPLPILRASARACPANRAAHVRDLADVARVFCCLQAYWQLHPQRDQLQYTSDELASVHVVASI